MQSQQKRVKWSRGETAEALEERADTGITNASVEYMENCIPDIYGNISRRPAFKAIPYGDHYFDQDASYFYGFKYSYLVDIIPFYISEKDYILIGIHDGSVAEFIRIKDGVCVYKYNIGSTQNPRALGTLGKVRSYAQQNNYLLIAGRTRVVKVTITLAANDYAFTPNVEFWEYSAGWYAPNGTETKSVTTTDVPGLSISGNFTNYIYTDVAKNTTAYSQTDTGLDGQANLDLIAQTIPVGSIITLPNIGTYLRIEGYRLDGSNNVMLFGALLTPVADSSATDSTVSVEYGYINLTPASFAPGGSQTNTVFPHPEQLCFHDQRLWAGSWILSNIYKMQDYSVVIGSQIARYNDLKNDYNKENEAITLDILTKYREKVLHLIDYNGLKIFTDSFEYAYEGGGVVKQSANGALENCAPIIFDSLCLYADKTGQQIKAMQYEFQSSIFNSTTINQMAPHDLVWNPVALASYEDKTYSTGKYLFIANTLQDTTPVLGVCNFVPGNQANIWSRWSIPKQDLDHHLNGLFNVLDMKDNALFFLVAYDVRTYTNLVVIPCVLDFTADTDLQGTIDSSGYYNIASTASARLTLGNTDIAIYNNGVYNSTLTTSGKGQVTLPAGLTSVTGGMPINATIRSHPIDVGGKTKSIKKRIGKATMSVRDTEADAITINGKTGYMNPAKDYISFYGVTGMKDEIKYTITNKNGAMFHLESLLMNIEYGTLDS